MNITQQCRLLYNENFGDGDLEFENLFFENCFEYCRLEAVDEKVVSMLFALPCEIIFDGGAEDAIYLFAAATKSEFRKKGYMSALIKRLMLESNKPIILRPANQALIGFYQKIGFNAFSAQAAKEVTPILKPKDNFLKLAEKIGKDEEETFKLMCCGIKSEKLQGLYFPYSME
ncbi:MAG: GNAT family N-acetyltransferase [Ruminococcaceae bacterium]|nr:GNAT family N-acetyltransferase [Oscillospiraceae bacterium]